MNDGAGNFSAGSITVNGVAATGAALAGATVTARCIAGPDVSGTTAADGSFTLSLSGGQSLPCMLKATGGTPAITLYSFAGSAGRVNLTPLTDFVVARALASDPAAAFDSFDATKVATITAGLVAAKAYVNVQVIAFAGSTQSIDILTGVFVVGDANDRVLDNFGLAMRAAGTNIADLRAVSVGGVVVNLVGVPALDLTISFAATGLYSAVTEQANSDFRSLLETACGFQGFRFDGSRSYLECKQDSSSPETDLLAKMLTGGLPHQIGSDIVSGPTSLSPGTATVTSNQGMPGVNVGDSCSVVIDASAVPVRVSVTVRGGPYFPQTDAAAFSFRGGGKGTDYSETNIYSSYSNSVQISSGGVVSEYDMTNSLGNRLEIRPNPQLLVSGSPGAEAKVVSADRQSYYVCK